MKIKCECGHTFEYSESDIKSHRVLAGDSTKAEDVARLFGDGKAELLFTSPPYSDMRDYNGEIDLSIDNLINFISTFEPFVNYQVINLGIQRKDNEIFPYWNAYIDKAKEVGYKLLSWNVWNREGSGFNMSQITAMFAISHEWLFVFGKLRKDLNLTIPNKTAGELNDHSWDRQKDGSLKKAKTHNTRDFRQLSTVETIITEHARIWTKNHPAIFPVTLPFRYIEAMTSESDIVCDCFGGSGTTLIASEQLQRQAYLMEIDPHYCDVIVKRFVDFVGSSDNVFCDRQGQKVEYGELL